MVAVRQDFGGLHRIGLPDAHEDEVLEDVLADSAISTIRDEGHLRRVQHTNVNLLRSVTFILVRAQSAPGR
jgi:hypothetical protein